MRNHRQHYKLDLHLALSLAYFVAVTSSSIMITLSAVASTTIMVDITIIVNTILITSEATLCARVGADEFGEDNHMRIQRYCWLPHRKAARVRAERNC